MIIIHALSVRQPWAFAITRLGKDVENRGWRHPPRLRGPILIHASKGLTRGEYVDAIGLGMPDGFPFSKFPSFEDVERGGIVGACEFYDVGEPLDRSEGWAQAGALRFKLRNPIALPLRPYPGALGFFRVELAPTERLALRAAGLLP